MDWIHCEYSAGVKGAGTCSEKDLWVQLANVSAQDRSEQCFDTTLACEASETVIVLRPRTTKTLLAAAYRAQRRLRIATWLGILRKLPQTILCIINIFCVTVMGKFINII